MTANFAARPQTRRSGRDHPLNAEVHMALASTTVFPFFECLACSLIVAGKLRKSRDASSAFWQVLRLSWVDDGPAVALYSVVLLD